jgi:hypothetical protein
MTRRERDRGAFEILIETGGGRTDRDFLIDAVPREDWAAQRVAGLNAMIERDNPREYMQGRRYYYRIASA